MSINLLKSWIFLGILGLTSNLHSQDWKVYPYHPNNSLISFPVDEGRHSEEPTEWWYTFAKLKGEETGNDYTIMLTFFYRDTLLFNGLRIFNISNETTGEFYHNALPINYIKNSETHLDIEATIFGQNRTEYWRTKKDSNDNLIPFQYSLHSKADFGEINLNYNVIKKPLILNDSGFLNQGLKNYTYYYSFTEIEITGDLTINGVKENVVGIGWFDKQYGNFHPEVEEKYEWLSLKLSNGIDINLWNIFNQSNELPDNPKYRLFNCYINDSTGYCTSKFNIERLEYFYSPDSSSIYTKKFKITEDSLNLDLIIEVANPNCEAKVPFSFYEGPVKVSGKINELEISGFGFGELLHSYQHPIIEIIEPSEDWKIDIPIKWSVKNPDEGNPLYFDVLSKNISDSRYKYLIQNTQDTMYQIPINQIALDSAYSFAIIAKSIDSFLTDTAITSGSFYPNSTIDFKKSLSFQAFPNPFFNRISIDFKNNTLSKGDTVQVYSENGKKIYEKIILNETNRINISLNSLSKGIYIVSIIKDNIVYIKKIVKE